MGPTMQPVKIAARFLDGTLVKGTTHNFNPNSPCFHVLSADNEAEDGTKEVRFSALKAVFFVKSFEGNPTYKDRSEFSPGDRKSGREVTVIFADGETMVGTVMEYNARNTGFFLFPVDPTSNNSKVYVVNSSVKDVTFAA